MIRIIENETGKILKLFKSKESIPPNEGFIEVLYEGFGNIGVKVISIQHCPNVNLIVIRVSLIV